MRIRAFCVLFTTVAPLIVLLSNNGAKDLRSISEKTYSAMYGWYFRVIFYSCPGGE